MQVAKLKVIDKAVMIGGDVSLRRISSMENFAGPALHCRLSPLPFEVFFKNWLVVPELCFGHAATSRD